VKAFFAWAMRAAMPINLISLD